MSLIYLLSSLPTLTLETAPVLSLEAFLEACREQLGEAEANAAAAVVSGDPSDHPFVVAWRDKEAIMRNAVARERARAAGADAERWLRPTAGCDTLVESLVEDAFQEGDPLSKEKGLDRVRWWIAEDLQGPDPLGIYAALSYAIKLSILWRWRALIPETGKAAFEALTHAPISLNPEPL